MQVLSKSTDTSGRRTQIQQRIEQRDTQLEKQLEALESSIEDVAEVSEGLRAEANRYEETEKVLQWAFPVSLAVAFGGAYLFKSTPILLGGLVAAAGSHFVRIAHSGGGSDIYGRLVQVSNQKADLARQASEITKQRSDLKDELAEQLEMLDVLTGDVARGLNVQVNEETVTVGDFELTRYS